MSSTSLSHTHENSITAKLAKYEKFVNEKLQVDLRQTLELRDKVYHQISEYVKLQKQITLIKSENLAQMKAMIDLGSNFYVQAKIPDTQYIYVNIGYGFHAELTFNEALEFIAKKENRLEQLAEKYTYEASKIKSHINLVLEAIAEVLQLERKERQLYREV